MKMSINSKIIKTATVSAILTFIIFSMGCVDNSRQNITQTLIVPNVSPITQITTQPLGSITQTQTQPEIPQTNVTTIVTPYFYGTITYGANRSSALTEEQAWEYAEAFFQKAGMNDIRSSDVVPLGQKVWSDKNNKQEMVWVFQVNWIITGSEGSYNNGGTIVIDANDGHIVDFSGYD
jgi:hypothetical protein